MVIAVDFVSNTSGLERGTDNIERALDGVADTLDDLARAGDKAGEKTGDALSDGIKDGSTDAEKHVEKLERKFRDLATAGSKESAQAGDDISRNVKRGTDGAADGLHEFKDEANSTARESAASFDGSAESIQDVFQEVAANAFAGFGPAGAVAGLAAAVGLGLAFAAMEDGTEQTEEYKEHVQELGQEFINTGGLGKSSLEFLIDRLKTLATETEDGQDNLAEMAEVADGAGNSFDDLANIYGNNADELGELLTRNEEYLEQLREEADAIDTTSQAQEGQYGALMEKIDAQEKYISYIRDGKSAAEEATEAERLYAEAGGPELERKAEAIDSVNSAYDGVRDAAIAAATSEEGVFDVGAWVAHVAEHKGLVEQYQANLALMELTPEQWQNYLDLPESARMGIAESWSSGDQATRQAISSTLTDAGGDGGKSAAVAFDESFSPTAEAEVNVTADAGPASDEIAKVTKKDYEAKIKVTTNNKAAAKDEIEKVAKDYTAKVKVTADTSSASTTISNFMAKSRSVNIVARIVDKNGKPVT